MFPLLFFEFFQIRLQGARCSQVCARRSQFDLASDILLTTCHKNGIHSKHRAMANHRYCAARRNQPNGLVCSHLSYLWSSSILAGVPPAICWHTALPKDSSTYIALCTLKPRRPGSASVAGTPSEALLCQRSGGAPTVKPSQWGVRTATFGFWMLSLR